MADNARMFMRVSFNADGYGSKNRNAVEAVLKPAGFDNPSTGMWETPKPIGLQQATGALRAVLDQIDNLVPNTNGDPVTLDHVWVYLSGE